MKKTILALLTLLTLPAWAVNIDVEGQRLPAEPAPILKEGRVLVPLRAVFQALEAQVDYRDSTITAVKEPNKIVLRPGERTAVVNGATVALDAPALLKNGTTYVPLRFVAQSLGEKVAWDGSSKTVTIGEGGIAHTGPSTSLNLKPKLQQLVVGNQGGVLKVRDTSGSQVVYYRGLDDRSVAPLSSADQQAILESLDLTANLAGVANQVMKEYSQTAHKKEALALLGVLNSLPDERLSPATASQVRSFLSDRMKNDSTVHNRRQAVLALAVGSEVDAPTVDAVLDFYQTSDNLWETFPVQQFFEYHAGRLQMMPSFPTVKQQALSVNSLYRDNIAGYLGG